MPRVLSGTSQSSSGAGLPLDALTQQQLFGVAAGERVYTLQQVSAQAARKCVCINVSRLWISNLSGTPGASALDPQQPPRWRRPWQQPAGPRGGHQAAAAAPALAASPHGTKPHAAYCP
mmetsp:Transcript_3269/g.7152  ORF Transcript_3269/g.7152 Transcript_3269/m.7152 type:complete len:119 (+) Transcript_3269:766-1122(+)